MDIFENSIMHYVAADHSTLVIPQYDLGSGWASLDFLGVNSKKQIIHLIEVTSAANICHLLRKTKEAFYSKGRVERLKQQLHKDYAGQYDSWEVRQAIFIRKENRDRFEQELPPVTRQRVDVFSIEECVFPWDYWERIVGEDRSWDRPAKLSRNLTA
ncbi:MAG TPA: hypothetical protein VN943_17225 [Candidatus Acidoferrum sp.]|nr:hypothetical protein [Candidatus Acidoferrum sp.]